MNHYSIAQRTPALNTLFAGAACAITLALTAGPALADTTTLERVEVRGQIVEAPVRYDVHAQCDRIDDQLAAALDSAWARQSLPSDVNVQFVLQNGQVEAVKAQGRYGVLARQVASAVRHLDCGTQASADAQIYRFTVGFTDTAGSASTAQAARHVGVRVARSND
ncbi:hypothetical protein [Pelomonas cellulosilytica]|uniref:Uncharacterized protein n=1 Tax=Pelomonas cellulosilytica TaxID=2906762 RepID=A0ABS8Y0X0_9BURK|nr:hypothetical protein [Pelomonas sp. P8]MCE4557842.1 hypothetical protein [Pelomonas sp. P8]